MKIVRYFEVQLLSTWPEPFVPVPPLTALFTVHDTSKGNKSVLLVIALNDVRVFSYSSRKVSDY